MTPSISLIIALGGREVTISKTSVYRLIAVTGLEAPPLNTRYTSYAAKDGGYITDKRIEPRPISFTFAIHDRDMTETLRRSLETFFLPKESGTLTVTRTGITRKIDFTLQTEPDFQQSNIITERLKIGLNLICPDPYFYDEQEIVYDMVESVPMLTFPLTTTASAGATAGIRRRTETITIKNTGDIPVGIIAEIISKGGAVTNPYVEANGKAVAVVDVTTINDVYAINTREGAKSLKKNGTKAYNFSPTSIFFQLPSGDNAVTISAESGSDNIESRVYIRMKYLGV